MGSCGMPFLSHRSMLLFSFPPSWALFLFTDHDIFSDTAGCGGRRGKAAQGAAGSIGHVGRRACGLSFSFASDGGYRRSHSPLLIGHICCFHYAYLYYSLFLFRVPDVKENFLTLFLRFWIHFFVLHSSNTFLESFFLLSFSPSTTNLYIF